MRFGLTLTALMVASTATAGEAYLIVDAETDLDPRPRSIGLSRGDGSPDVHIRAGQSIVQLKPADYSIDHVHTETAIPNAASQRNPPKSFSEEISLSEPLALEVPDGSIVFVGVLKITNATRDHLVTLDRDMNLLKSACAAKPELFARLPVYILDDAFKLGAPIRLECGG